MSIENLTRFASAVQNDSALQEKLHASVHDDPAARAAAAARLSKDAGTPFTAEEFLKAQSSGKVGEELTDEQLGSVAGGGDFENFFASIMNAFAMGKCDPPRDEPTGPYANYKPRGWK